MTDTEKLVYMSKISERDISVYYTDVVRVVEWLTNNNHIILSWEAFLVEEQNTIRALKPEKSFYRNLHNNEFPSAALVIESIEKAMDDYYVERGWDVKEGVPTEVKLKELGLDKHSNV